VKLPPAQDGKLEAGKSGQGKILQAVKVLLQLVLVVWFCLVGRRVYRQWACSKWPAVEGWVIDTAYREFGSRRAGERGAAELTVRYEYQVAGRKYQSDEFLLGVKKYKRDAEHVCGLTNQYYAGAPVKVLYDPARPARAVVRSDPNLTDKIVVVFLAIAIGFVGFNFKAKAE
jgi:hypothetical protein